MDVVTCPSCREENPAKFRLCGFCGASLAPAPETVVCPSCGEENPGRFRLCGFCGTTLQGGGAAPVPPPSVLPTELGASEVRKPATFIFVDLKGSTALTERIDQEAMSEIKKRYFTVMAAQIERHGGTIEKYIGDAIMAVFGIPRAHEDDALRAVRAAHGMQQELITLNADFQRFYGVELANRTGVNTGEVVANTDPTANQQLATGDTVNVAARLEQAAPANEILIGETTYDLVRAHVEVEAVEPLELKGKSERVPAFRLLRVRDPGETGASATGALREAPLVGRTDELRQLEARLAATVERERCLAITVIGDPGVGKTRLVRDFTVGHAETARVLRGRCLPYGDGITFWPLAEIARDAAGITEDDTPDLALGRLAAAVASAGDDAPAITERMAAAMGLSAASWPVTELFWGGRRFLETLADGRAVLAVVDDLHWAQPTFLAFIEHLVSTAEAPILLLGTARHVLLERQADWGARTDGPILELAPLTAEDAAGLVDHLLGGTELDEGTRARVVASADGNPLFVEQLVSMLVDKGLLQRVDGRWQPSRELADLTVPPTIQALLASRLDDLSREERAVVEPASVIGVTFFEPAVEEMVPGPVRPSVPGYLQTLDGKQFIARDASDPDEETYRFRHGLIREATYGSLLKRTRAQLHERFVTWAERVNKERGREQEFEEILGFHLEQAFRYRTELGPLDDASRDLARRAALKLSNAGRRAYGRGDMPAAASLLQRATSLLPEEDPLRLDLLPELAGALMEKGDFAEATGVAGETAALAGRLGDGRLAARARLVRQTIDLFSGASEDREDDVVADIHSGIATLSASGDEAGLAHAYRLLMIIHGTVGRYDDAAIAAETAVTHSRRAGDPRSAARAASGYATVALGGPTPVGAAIERCEALLAEVRGDRKAEAVILGVLAQLRAMRGEFEEARAMAARGRDMLDDLGPSVTAASTSTESYRVEVLAGDLTAAEHDLRRDHDRLEAMDEHYFRSTIAALLAGVLVEQGRLDEASRYASVAAELTDEEDVASNVLWRAARARIDARGGHADGAAEAAVGLAEEAVTMAGTTQDLVLQADARVALADVLTALGRDDDDARVPLREALALYDRKGDEISAGRIRARLGEPG